MSAFDLKNGLAQLLHDIEKPRNNFRMFKEVFNEISKDPKQLAFWLERIETSFDTFDARVREFTNYFEELD